MYQMKRKHCDNRRISPILETRKDKTGHLGVTTQPRRNLVRLPSRGDILATTGCGGQRVRGTRCCGVAVSFIFKITKKGHWPGHASMTICESEQGTMANSLYPVNSRRQIICAEDSDADLLLILNLTRLGVFLVCIVTRLQYCEGPLIRCRR